MVGRRGNPGPAAPGEQVVRVGTQGIEKDPANAPAVLAIKAREARTGKAGRLPSPETMDAFSRSKGLSDRSV